MEETTVKLKEKSDLKKIFELSWPVMIGMILQSLLGTVDTKFIGMLGKAQLSAASFSNSVAGVIFVMSSLVSAGTIALVSRSYGEGDMKAVKKYSSESFLLSAIIGGSLSIICCLYTEPIIKIMFNPKPKVLELAKQHLSIVFLGTIFVFLNSALRTIMQALGDTKTPLIIFGISNILNAILAPFLIFICKLGIRGAAWAMVISTIYSFIAINYVLIKKIYNGNIREFLSTMKLDMDSSTKILEIGGWACVQQVARPITGLLMVGLVYKVGEEAGSAGFGIGGQLFNYTFIFLAGLSTAIAIMVGQSLGRKDIHGCDSIIKEGIKLATVNMVIFAVPYFIFPEFFIGLFSNEAGVIGHGAAYLRIVYVGVIFVIFPTIYGGVFQGAGDTFPPMISSLIANVVLKVPIAYLLALGFKMGTNGVWIAVALSVIIEAVMIIFFFRKGKWKEKVI